MSTPERGLVGLVLVSHSRRLAEGLAELASQMAPDVPLHAVGGLPDGSLGTDYDEVVAALSGADRGAGVVVLYDLGSAQLTADLAVETLGESGRTFVVDAPFVEGTVAAAVAAQGGADLDAVAASAAAAVAEIGAAPGNEQPVESRAARGGPAPVASRVAEPVATQDILLSNEVGLHARPAALLVRAVSELDAEVEVGFRGATVDGKSVLALMGLGAGHGDTITLTARGPAAAQAVRDVVDLAARGFDE